MLSDFFLWTFSLGDLFSFFNTRLELEPRLELWWLWCKRLWCKRLVCRTQLELKEFAQERRFAQIWTLLEWERNESSDLTLELLSTEFLSNELLRRRNDSAFEQSLVEDVVDWIWLALEEVRTVWEWRRLAEKRSCFSPPDLSIPVYDTVTKLKQKLENLFDFIRKSCIMLF